jgi:hypothetical protein
MTRRALPRTISQALIPVAATRPPRSLHARRCTAKLAHLAGPRTTIIHDATILTPTSSTSTHSIYLSAEWDLEVWRNLGCAQQ